MYELKGGSLGKAFIKYKTVDKFFPIIGSVILGHQHGYVYADNIESPKQIYVEHSFGFAQIFGHKVAEFENNLEKYLLVEKEFKPEKVRLYGSYVPEFFSISQDDFLVSQRQRFVLNSPNLKILEESDLLKKKDFKISSMDKNNINEVERIYGEVTRFWPTIDDFINYSKPIVLYYGDQIAGICCAAAQADERVEIDVLIDAKFRRRGLAKYMVTRFIKECKKKSLIPLWDCFTNNVASMELSKTLGFVPVSEPYPLYTIYKKNSRL